MTIIEDRLIEFELDRGSHDPGGEDGYCLLEAVAWVAGEPWTDHPDCVDPVLGAFGREWNDSLPDEDRTRLLAPFIPRLIGTRGAPPLQDRRAFMAADWAVRTYTPAWLKLAGMHVEAASLESLADLDSVERCREAMSVIHAAGAAAGAAAGDAAWAAAGAAAGDAAWAAAWAAARAKLRPTVVELQPSAVELLDRMIKAA